MLCFYESMLKLRKLNELYDMAVYTDSGDFFGNVDESILLSNKVYGWRVKATRDSFLSKVLGSAKGVVIPHQLVKSIGDVMIISKTAIPSPEREEAEAPVSTESSSLGSMEIESE